MNARIDCANILAKTHCIASTKDESVSVKENDTELIFVNKNRDSVVKFDIDCLLDEYHAAPPYDFKRCDFMVKHKGINYYIELKTGDYRGACNQIASAIKNLNECFGGEKCKAIVVVFLPNMTPFITDFQKEFQCEFRKSDLMQCVIDDICDAPEIETAPDAVCKLP